MAQPNDSDDTLINIQRSTTEQDVIPSHTVVEIQNTEHQVIFARNRDIDTPSLVEWCDNHTPGRRWEIETNDVIIGRDDACDLTIQMSAISRQHMRIIRTEDGCFIEDMNSKNGTWVNGERIQERTRLRDGDEINVALVLKLIVVTGK